MKKRRASRRAQAGFSLIELLIAITIIGIMAAVAVPSLLRYLKTGRETAAVQSLREIHNSQAQYQALRGRFATLKELVDNELLDKGYAAGTAINGYIYKDSDITPDTYCVHADRASDSTANRDFNITERGIVHYIESPSKGTVERGAGTPISTAEAASGGGEEKKQ